MTLEKLVSLVNDANHYIIQNYNTKVNHTVDSDSKPPNYNPNIDAINEIAKRVMKLVIWDSGQLVITNLKT